MPTQTHVNQTNVETNVRSVRGFGVIRKLMAVTALMGHLIRILNVTNVAWSPPKHPPIIMNTRILTVTKVFLILPDTAGSYL